MKRVRSIEEDFELEQKETNRWYRRNLKGKTIRDVRTFLGFGGDLGSLDLYFTDGTSIEFTPEGVNTSKLERKREAAAEL